MITLEPYSSQSNADLNQGPGKGIKNKLVNSALNSGKYSMQPRKLQQRPADDAFFCKFG